MIRYILAALVAFFPALPGLAASLDAPARSFASIDGGTLELGGVALVTNTASLCAFSPQYEQLQDLHEAYGPQGLTVLAVPSDDFRQELASEAEVKEFCSVNFGLTLPMTVITPVRGGAAHPFYRWLSQEHGIEPGWNFHKVLIGPEGDVLGSWGSGTRPTAPSITRAVEAALGN